MQMIDRFYKITCNLAMLFKTLKFPKHLMFQRNYTMLNYCRKKKTRKSAQSPQMQKTLIKITRTSQLCTKQINNTVAK